MSYRAFKEYIQSCPVRSFSGFPSSQQGLDSLTLPDGEERKPRKTSLKDKIASLDLFGAGSLTDPKEVLSSSDLVPVASGSDRSGEDDFGSKRVLLEGYAEVVDKEDEQTPSCRQLDDLRTNNTSSSQLGLCRQRTISGPPQVAASLPTDSLPVSVFPRHQKGIISVNLVEEDVDARILPLGEEEEFARDSEAGLFAQPEPEGPFEPLILWPPAGEGTSNGVGEQRIIQVPPSINCRLLEHQREGVHFLYNLYRNNKGGILGDDMGLGKTIQAIAFLAAILQKDSQMEGSLLLTSSAKVGAQKQRYEKVVLIICPTSVLQNWEREFEAWGDFQIGMYHGPQRDIVFARVEAKELEIVLTSHDTFRIHGDQLCEIKWECAIVDEAHRLKNERSQLYVMCSKLRTKRRYGLTGTVMQNKYMELFNVFDWAIPGCLGRRDHFREYYDRPIAEGQRISAPQRFVVIAEDRKKHLNLMLRSYFLRRTKQETIGHLMKGKEDNVVFCPMSAVQKRVYKRVLQSPDYQALINKTLPCLCGSPLTRGECCYRIVPDGIIWPYLHKDSLHNGCDICPYCLVLPCLTKLRQVSNHLELIKPNPKDDPEKQEKDVKFALMAFGEDIDVVGGIQQEQSFLGLSDTQHCGKMGVLEKLLSSWSMQGDKVLLFSDSVRMLDILEKFLIRKGYSSSRLDGSIPMSTRQSLVEDFNNSPSKQIFLISTRAGGLGLNLTSANRVVIFDPNWNPAHDLQAQDRSFRFGQIRHVTVFRLLAAGSLEELVYTRQIYKQQLFNIALTGVAEKRYFEGVQGSKEHRGELFGISNLFRDMSEDLFAEDIIENHEERLVRIQRTATLEDMPRAMLQNSCPGPDYAREEIDHHGDLSCVEADEAGSPELPCTENDRGDTEDDRKTQSMVHKALMNAGVLYSHRNEDVVNLGLPALKTSRRTSKHELKPQNKVKRQQNEGLEKQACRIEKGKKVRQCQQKRLREDIMKDRDSNTPTPVQPKRRSFGETKREAFAQLAKFKGMDMLEFSKWYLSATPQERSQLRSNYSESLART